MSDEARRVHARLRAQRMAAARQRGRHTDEEWRQLVMDVGWSCVRCDKTFMSGGFTEGLTKDHRLPVTAGGSDAIDNIQPLCLRCNSRKGTDPADYLTTFWMRWWGQSTRPTREQQSERLDSRIRFYIEYAERYA